VLPKENHIYGRSMNAMFSKTKPGHVVTFGWGAGGFEDISIRHEIKKSLVIY
jgi:hypothetical protein